MKDEEHMEAPSPERREFMKRSGAAVAGVSVMSGGVLFSTATETWAARLSTLNAVQAMPRGGTLRFDARRGPARTVELSVSDTGVGIEPDALARIFDLYFTTKAGGTGLGLSMVYRTVHLHDGTIEVESTPGHGTTFRLRLPRA